MTDEPITRPTLGITVQEIVIRNDSTVLTDAEVEGITSSLQTQVTRDFAPVWNTPATLRFLPHNASIEPHAWLVAVLDNSDQAGALGYHDLTSGGTPQSLCFAKTDMQYGALPSVTISHELLEMLADPNINRVYDVDLGDKGIWRYACEVGDACEADGDGYEIDGSMVSDFVTPEWFNAQAKAPAAFDHNDLLTEPLSLRPGGYISVDKGDGQGWTQVFGQLRTRQEAYRARPHIGSRRERRRTRRSEWVLGGE